MTTAPHPAIQAPRFVQDLALVQACIDGDRRAWEDLLRRHDAAVRLAAAHTLRGFGATIDDEGMDDLVSDLFVELVRDDFRRLRAYGGLCQLGAWLKVVATRHTIDHLRRRKPMVSLQDDAPPAKAVRESLASPTLDPEADLGQAHLRAAVRALWGRLLEEDQRFIELFFLQELPFEEVARQMQTTVGALYARKNRVRKKLIALAQEEGLLPP
jgi:RNA polymerase sigma factor (sigma-70 family)